MEEEQDLYWGMHFCNSRMFKTIARIQMYLAEQKEEYVASEKKHIKYYMRRSMDKYLNLIRQTLYPLNSIYKIWYGFRIRILRGFILGNI